MSEHAAAGAPALSTNIESGKFDEKEAHNVPAKQRVEEEEEEDEDIDALIDDLESNDGHAVSFFLFFQSSTHCKSACSPQLCHPIARARFWRARHHTSGQLWSGGTWPMLR